jgi:hypothetical protein
LSFSLTPAKNTWKSKVQLNIKMFWKSQPSPSHTSPSFPSARYFSTARKPLSS